MNRMDYNKLIKENKDLFEWKRSLSLILRYSSKITALTNIKDILNTLAEVTREALHADRSAVFLLDKEKNEIFSWVAQGVGSRQIRFDADKGLAGYVVSTGKTVNVADAYNDDRFNPEIDRETGYRTRTILGMPMMNQGGQTIGVFQVLNKTNGEVFTGRDEEILRLLSQQAAAAIESAQLCEEMTRSFTSFINTLAEAIDARDPLTAGHSHRVCGYSELIAQKMDYNEDKIEVLKYASLLHDLGKIGIKEAVLTKPGKLTDDEYRHIQTHAEVTRKILERTYLQPKFRNLPIVASAHHENVDGSGYPEKLKGENIPEMARIMAVADVFDALTYWRRYRDPMSINKAVNELKKNCGIKFDPVCVEALLNVTVNDILQIMLAAAKNQISETDFERFANITLGSFAEMIENDSGNGFIEIFNQYYPVRLSEIN